MPTEHRTHDYIMKVKLHEQGGLMPAKTNEYAAGYDLFLPKNTTIYPGRQIVPLGFSISLPLGVVGWITSRSGFASKGIAGRPVNSPLNDEYRYDADVIDGKVDPDYRGIVGVIIKSNESCPFEILAGTKIAQMILVPFMDLPTLKVTKLDQTERGEGGFGSTGVY